jgi:hypothetical protein
MNHQQSELKGQLMGAAEEAIAAVMDWEAAHSGSDFGEIEALMLRIRKRLGEQMTAALVASQAPRRSVPGPACPHCGREMHYKGDKHLSFGSLVGDIELERGHYYCDHCECGLFPPG